MLEDQIKRRNDSGAICWYVSIFLNNMLTLYPSPSLVKNMGLDAPGTHCDLIPNLISELSNEPIVLEKIPIEENQHARQAFEKIFCSNRPILRKI